MTCGLFRSPQSSDAFGTTTEESTRGAVTGPSEEASPQPVSSTPVA